MFVHNDAIIFPIPLDGLNLVYLIMVFWISITLPFLISILYLPVYLYCNLFVSQSSAFKNTHCMPMIFNQLVKIRSKRILLGLGIRKPIAYHLTSRSLATCFKILNIIWSIGWWSDACSIWAWFDFDLIFLTFPLLNWKLGVTIFSYMVIRNPKWLIFELPQAFVIC